MALGIDVEHIVRYLHHGVPDRVLWSVSVDRGEIAVHGFAPLRAERPALPLDQLADLADAAALSSASAHWAAAYALDDDAGEGYALRFRAGPLGGRDRLVQ